MKNILFTFFIIPILIICFIGFSGNNKSPTPEISLNNSRNLIFYVDMDVPKIDSTFKTFMDYRTITNKVSNQYKIIHDWTWVDSEGFVRCSGEKNLGIVDDYYCIALGSYYGTTIGTKYKITTDSGNIFYGILTDCKSDKHTNTTNQYSFNNDIVEFIVDIKILNKEVKYHGNANSYKPLKGNIIKIEKMIFNGGK